MIPRFPDEKAAMKLVFATLIRAADLWCRVSISDLERHQLTLLRAELGPTPSQHRQPQNQPTQRHCRMISRPPIHRALGTRSSSGGGRPLDACLVVGVGRPPSHTDEAGTAVDQ